MQSHPIRFVAIVLILCAWSSAQVSRTFSSSYSSSSGTGSESCFNTQTGFTTDDARPYTYNMEPERSDFDIDIPEYPGCERVGVSVSVCESNGASTNVQLVDNAHAYIRRTGNLNSPGQADIVVYCAT